MRLGILPLLVCARLVQAADPPLKPVTVCEVLENLSAYDGKVAAVVGRFSYRQAGRWLGEQACPQRLIIGDQQWPNAFWIAYDPASAPKPPAVLAVDSALLAQKLLEVKRSTALSKIPFGSEDYDAWAVVYGRIETRKDLVLATAGGPRKNGYGYGESSPARLVCHGEAVIVFLNDEATKPASR